MLCQCDHSPLHILSFMYITFSASQFKQVWSWDVDQMLYFTLEKHKPNPAGGAHSASPDPLAGFTPILCLVKFFIGPDCVWISLYPHFKMKIYHNHWTKNYLTAWAPIRLGGPIRFGGPVSTLVSPRKSSPWGPGIVSCNILAVNNNPLEDFPKRFLFCHENKQL